MKRRKPRLPFKRRDVSQVPMAPMIDMVFLLLVFFMCVSTLSQAGHRVPLELPVSTSSEVPKNLADRIILSVQEDGSVFLAGSPIPANALKSRLEELNRQYPGIKLRIRADRRTAFEDIRKTMSAASDAGISEYIYGAVQGD